MSKKRKQQFKYVKKPINKLNIGEVTSSSKSSRYKGLSIQRTKKGYCVCSRIRSKFYKKPSDIPNKEIKLVEKFA